MKCVYVAGAFSADNVMDILGNMRRGLALATEVLSAGFAPFAPWLDYHFTLYREIELEQLYGYSISWLKKSEAVIVVPQGAEQSVGTQRELAIAREIGIPIFWSLDELKTWSQGND